MTEHDALYYSELLRLKNEVEQYEQLSENPEVGLWMYKYMTAGLMRVVFIACSKQIKDDYNEFMEELGSKIQALNISKGLDK